MLGGEKTGLMRYPLTVPGMEGHVIEVTTAGLGRPPALLIDSLAAPPGQERGEYLVFRPDGTLSTVKLTSHPLDIVPKVSVNGQPLVLTEPLQWYEWLLIALPLTLVFLGLPGALFGTAAAVGNLLIFRSRMEEVVRCLSAFGIAVAAFALVFSIKIVMRDQSPSYTPAAPRRSFFRPHSLFRHCPAPPTTPPTAPGP